MTSKCSPVSDLPCFFVQNLIPVGLLGLQRHGHELGHLGRTVVTHPHGLGDTISRHGDDYIHEIVDIAQFLLVNPVPSSRVPLEGSEHFLSDAVDMNKEIAENTAVVPKSFEQSANVAAFLVPR